MIIRSLSMENFKRFRSLRLELDDGLNVVKGPNESGKSTLIQAIFALLYWRPNANRKEVRECISWGRDEGFLLEMKAVSQRGEWQLAKDFAKKTVRLDCGSERLSDIERVEEWIGEETGLLNETAYRVTAGIRQDEVENIAQGRDDLQRSLQASVTGGGEGVSARDVVSAMQKARSDLVRGLDRPVKNAGAIAAVESRLQSLEENRRQLVERVESLRRARLREKELAGELAERKEELVAAENLQEAFQEQLNLEAELDELRERFAETDQTVTLWNERDSLVQQRKGKYSRIEEALNEKRDWLDRAEVRLKGLDESIQRMENECARLEKSPDKEVVRWPWLMALGIILILAGIGLVFVSTWLGVAAVVIGVVLAMFAVMQTRVRRTEGKAVALASFNQQLQDLRLERSSLDRSVRGVISEVGAASTDNFEQVKQAYFTLLDDLRDVENKLEVLSRGRNKQDLEKEMKDLALAQRVRESRLEELGRSSIDPMENQKAQVRAKAARKQVEDLKREKIRLEYQLEQSGSEEENLIACEEEMAVLAEEAENLKRRARAFDLAIDWMEQALSLVVQVVKEDVQEKVGEMVAAITGGRYDRVRIVDDDFNLEAYSREKGGEVPVDLDTLSRGTVDQVYLSARLALIESICGANRPPLILDDPLVTFDPGRIERAFRLLKEYARDYQILLFTCSDHYDDYADRVIDLSL